MTHKRSWGRLLCCAAGAALLGWGLCSLSVEASQGAALASVAVRDEAGELVWPDDDTEEGTQPDDDTDEGTQPDDDRDEGTRTLPEEVCAWMSVDGTTLSLPVAQATEEEPEAWLSKSLWGGDSSSGTPFVDWRTSADAMVVTVYGHNMSATGTVFAPLSGTWQEESFERLGALRWETAEGVTELQPLCAMRVEETWAQIRAFDHTSAAAMRLWLYEAVLPDAQAVSSEAEALVAGAERVVMCVTCSEAASGQPWRCVTVFVG